VALAACLALACGDTDPESGPNGPGDDERPGSGDTQPPQTPTDPQVPPTTPSALCAQDADARRTERVLRRLTGPQIESTVRTVFGLDVATWAGPNLPPDPAAQNGFNNNAERLQINDTFAQRFQTMAEQVGTLVSTAPHLDRISSCAGVGDLECAHAYLDTIGRQLYRRSLTDEERAGYLALYDDVMEQDDFAVWIKWTTVGLLQSPNTLYRSEMGALDEEGLYRLTGLEMASALAYGLTGAPPALDLIDQAESGQLDTLAQRRAAAHALAFAGDRPSAAVSSQLVEFTANWLGVVGLQNRVRDGEMFPDFDSAVKTSMQREFDTFIHHVLVEQGAGPSLLFSAPYTFVDSTLTAFYGYGEADGDRMVRVNRPAEWGVGILSLGAFQTAHAHGDSTSPTKRGHMVRERVLCNTLGPPPADIPDIAPPAESTTTRQRYEDLHAAAPECSGCHQLMDPIGFGFEHLDATGRFRADENGHEIDDTGEIVSLRLGQANQAFHGPTELADELADSEEAAHCFTTFFASYTYGLDEDETRCLANDLAGQFRTGEITASQLMVELLVSDVFTVRKETTDAEPEPEDDDDDEEMAPPALTPEVTVETVLQSAHDGGHCMNATVTNTGDTDVTWAVDLEIEGTITTVWEASGYGDTGTVRFAGHEARTMTLAVGASHTFGWCATLP